MSSRPSYEIVDEQDRQAELESRNNIISKSFVTDLWMRVITKAIEDLALYKTMRIKGKILDEEDIENEESAKGFLFDDDYIIAMDDYLVDAVCPKCFDTWTDMLSSIVGENSFCPLCNTLINRKYVEYTIKEEQQLKEITFTELISLWGIEDVKGFRSGVKKRIEDIVEKKCKNISK